MHTTQVSVKPYVLQYLQTLPNWEPGITLPKAPRPKHRLPLAYIQARFGKSEVHTMQVPVHFTRPLTLAEQYELAYSWEYVVKNAMCAYVETNLPVFNCVTFWLKNWLELYQVTEDHLKWETAYKNYQRYVTRKRKAYAEYSY